jgi:RimJ/RimL family protein N-acetyltransferase
MNLQPTLKGERLTLRPLRQEDYDGLFAAASDPKIWEVHPIPDRYLPETFKTYFEGLIKSHGAMAIIDNQTQEIVGTSSFYGHKPEEKSVIIGYTFLTRKYWGGDFNREIKKLMMDYAFEYVETCIFHVGVDNIRSRKAMGKIGGVLYEEFEKIGFRGKLYKNVAFKIEKKSYSL